MIIFYLTNMVTGGSAADEPEANTAIMSRTWVGVGVAVILLIMVHIKWP
jgi:hypothetical protein